MASGVGATDTSALESPGDRLTLVEGSAFLIAGVNGDVSPASVQGFFFRDNRFLSRWRCKVNSQAVEVLATATPDPFSATLVGRARPQAGRDESSLVVVRHRYVGRGMREDLTVRNYGNEPAYCAIELQYGADFADRFDVKEARASEASEAEPRHIDGCLVFSHRFASHERSLRISFSQPAKLDAHIASWEAVLPPNGEWSLCQQFSCAVDRHEIEPRWLCGQPVARATPAERMAQWRRSVPVVDTDHEGLRAVLARSAEDLGTLRIFDPDFPERTVVAAGAPWSMTLFGRDSLLSAWMALVVDPELALGTLQTLARFQGAELNARTEEQPGRILHEMRFGEASSLSLGAGTISYGTADATPLFVMLLGELRRWGLAREAVDELLPHADRAIEWIENYGDIDGDGYVEYQRMSDRGPAHQGWKGSRDAIRYADGRLAEAPIALAEVQGYVYGAYLARAFFAAEQGDGALSARLRLKAAELKAAFNRDFWVEEHGWVAMGLDRDKRPIDALASNMGHCLWTGILDADKADRVAKRLLSPALFSGPWSATTPSATTRARCGRMTTPCAQPASCVTGSCAKRSGSSWRNSMLRSARADGSPNCSPAWTASSFPSSWATPRRAPPRPPRQRHPCSCCARCCASTRGSPGAKCGCTPRCPSRSATCMWAASPWPAPASASPWKATRSASTACPPNWSSSTLPATPSPGPEPKRYQPRSTHSCR